MQQKNPEEQDGSSRLSHKVNPEEGVQGYVQGAESSLLRSRLLPALLSRILMEGPVLLLQDGWSREFQAAGHRQVKTPRLGLPSKEASWKFCILLVRFSCITSCARDAGTFCPEEMDTGGNPAQTTPPQASPFLVIKEANRRSLWALPAKDPDIQW